MPKDRIMEDPLRMLRAARFAARYNFSIDPNFIGKARQLSDRIYDVSVERWVMELDKLLTAEYRDTGLTELFQMEVLYRILPEIMSLSHITYRMDKDYETADQAWRALLLLLDDNIKVARYQAGGICARLKFSNERTNIVLDKVKKKE